LPRHTTPDNAQLWHLDQINTHYRVLSEATGEALVITGGSYSTWALITTRAAASSSDEYWQFEQRTNASTDPATMGQWGPLISWPFVPVHVAVLDDNRLLTWSAKERDEFNIPGPYRTFAAVYDINTGGFTDANIAQEDMFCSGTAQMADGRIFASGGNPSNNDSTQIFDPQKRAKRCQRRHHQCCQRDAMVRIHAPRTRRPCLPLGPDTEHALV